jgi:hypothetical protein
MEMSKEKVIEEIRVGIASLRASENLLWLSGGDWAPLTQTPHHRKILDDYLDNVEVENGGGRTTFLRGLKNNLYWKVAQNTGEGGLPRPRTILYPWRYPKSWTPLGEADAPELAVVTRIVDPRLNAVSYEGRVSRLDLEKWWTNPWHPAKGRFNDPEPRADIPVEKDDGLQDFENVVPDDVPDTLGMWGDLAARDGAGVQ